MAQSDGSTTVVSVKTRTEILEELKKLNWVGFGNVTASIKGKKDDHPYLYFLLAVDPVFAKAIARYSPNIKEVEHLLNITASDFLFCLHSCLLEVMDGKPLNLNFLRWLEAQINHTFSILVKARQEAQSASDAQLGEQPPPSFLAYDHVKVEERLLDAMQFAVLNQAVIPIKKIEELLEDCSLAEEQVLRQQIEKLNNRAAELLLRKKKPSKDKFADELIDIFEDFFHKTEH